jgi:hypothetical protein
MKHVDPKFHQWIKQENQKTINVKAIPCRKNTADIMTKALPKIPHAEHVLGLGMMDQSKTSPKQSRKPLH